MVCSVHDDKTDRLRGFGWTEKPGGGLPPEGPEDRGLSLDYSGLFEECVRDASWPESYFRDEKTGAWKRRRSRRLW